MTTARNRKLSVLALGAMVLAGCGHQQAASAPGHTGVNTESAQEQAAGLAKLQAQTQAQQATQAQSKQQTLATGLAKLQAQSQNH